MTDVSRQILEIGDIKAKSVAFKGTALASIAQGSLVYFSAADEAYVPWTADCGVQPDGVVRNAFTVPAGGTTTTEIIFAGRLNDALISLPGTMTADSIPTEDGEDAPAAAVGAADAGNTGGGAITAAPVVGSKAKAGVYEVTCIDADVSGAERFQVVDPDGIALEDAVTDVAYSNNHLGFTISAASYDPDKGDKFTVTVTGVELSKSLRAHFRTIGIFFETATSLYS